MILVQNKMQSFNPTMLRLARDYRKCSQEDLSKETGIAQGTLSKIENGIALPEDRDLTLIAEALDVLPCFFLSVGKQYPPMQPFHRKRLTVPKKIVSKAEALGNIQRNQINSLLSQIENFESDFPEFDIDDYSDGAKGIAVAARRWFGLPRGPIENMVELLEDHGAIISYVRFESRKLDGFTLKGANGDPPFIFVNEEASPENKRMTLAHELGHILMHRIIDDNCEDEAWSFASEFLMPSDEIIGEYPARFTRVNDAYILKRKWKVPLRALVYKAEKVLGIISERTSRYLYMQLNQIGDVDHEPIAVDAETPTSIKELFHVFSEELGYSPDDFSQLLGLKAEEIEEWYFNRPVKPKFKLIRFDEKRSVL